MQIDNNGVLSEKKKAMQNLRNIYRLTVADKELVKSLSDVLFGKTAPVQLALPDVFVENTQPVKSYSDLKSLSGREFKEKDASFDTDAMGYYTPADYTVTLLYKVISDVASRLEVNEDILRSIVLVHEIGHYVTQCSADALRPDWQDMVKSSCDFWKDSPFMLDCCKKNHHVASPEYLQNCSKKYIETLAQLVTYLAVKEKPAFLNVFMKLASVQTESYTAFKQYLSIDSWEFKRAVSYMRSLDYLNQSRPDMGCMYVSDRDLQMILL